MDKRIGNAYLQNPVRAELVEVHGAYPSTGSGRTACNSKFAIIFLLFLCSVGSAYAGIILRMTDAQGYDLEQVAAGQPFSVEVVVTDVGSQVSAPSVQGDARITLQNRGQYFTTTNGKTTAKYLYQARIDEPGVYIIGPAQVAHAGQSIASNTLYITVGTTQKTVGKQHKKDSEDFLFELSVDKERVYIGESIIATLTFYYDDTVALKNIAPPALEGFVLRGDVNKYTQGQEKIKGSLYKYVRWEWQLSPTKLGTLTIPVHGAEYEKLSSNNHRLGLEVFFMGRNERLRTYSNALSIQVDPLPPYNGFVTAIGLFKNVTATVEQSVAQEGEALVLAIEFEGEGDLEAIKTPELRGMPDALRYYDSKNYIVESEHKKQFPKKRFEYIVQGLRAGTWKIPQQEFVIFDVDKEVYKTFKTKPVTVTITPNSAMQKAGAIPNSSDQDGMQADIKDGAPDVLLPIDETGLWYRMAEPTPMPWWLFLLLSMLPGVYLLAMLVWRLIQKRIALREPAMRAKKAFIIARNALEKAQDCNDITQIYTIVIQLIADRCQIESKDITQDFIENKLQEAGVLSLDRTKWHDFFMRATEATYGQKVTDGNSLFTQAKKLIDTLEGVL